MVAEEAVLAEEAPVEAGKQDPKQNMMQQKMITILGPTASGKTSFAVQLAAKLNGEIISGDSRQLYRRMDIGTGKDLNEYTLADKAIPYHLIDIMEPGDKYSLFDFQRDFHIAYQEILRRKKCPILCGGTGLYIESVLKGYNLPNVPPNPSLRKNLNQKSLAELESILRSYGPLHNTTDIQSKKRAIRAIEIADHRLREEPSQANYPPIESVIMGLRIERNSRRENISRRLRTRLQEGLIEEVEQLLDEGIDADDLIYYGLEYKFVTLHVIGSLTYEEMFRQLEMAIHQFAKRQMTWFRGMERRGLNIHWIDANKPMEEKLKQAFSILSM